MRSALALALCLTLAGCIPAPAKVASTRVDALDKSYTVVLPEGWIRQYTQEKVLVASRDGFLLESIVVLHRPLKQAFPHTKRDASDGMLGSELAELQIAELKARYELTAALGVQDNEPAVLGGRAGFRVRVSYRTPRGLEIYEEVFGAADKSGLYLLAYRAPRLYYFDKYYPEFQKTVGSFAITAKK